MEILTQIIANKNKLKKKVIREKKIVFEKKYYYRYYKMNIMFYS